jgi:copper(I)-binding protein
VIISAHRGARRAPGKPSRARALRGLAAVAAAALVPAIAGCEAGQNAPTQQWHQPTPGASAVVHKGSYTIRVNNVFVLGAAPGSSLAAGSSAGMFFALANEGSPDRLTGISAPGVASSVRLPGGGVRLGRQQSVFLTGPVPRVILQRLSHGLGGGQFIRVVLSFQNAGTVPLSVPVMPRAQYYATYSPVPVSPTPTPTATSRHPATPGATPSPTPT